MQAKLKHALVALAVALTTLASNAALAQSESTLNLKDADINALIATVSEITGKNFIIDPRVKGKVTVLSSTPMSADGVYETFLAVLQVHGFAAIPAGEAIKIIPEVNAKQDGAPTRGEFTVAPDDVITRVVEVENVPAAQLVPILRPLVPQYGHLAALAVSNMLIISDRAANVIRLREIIRRIDQSPDRQVELIKLESASAREVAQTLTTLTQQAGKQDPNAGNITVLADERTNSIILGGDKATRNQLRGIILELDTPLDDEGATQVLYLRFASAENLGPILQGYVEQAAQSSGGQAQGGNNAARGGSSNVRVIPEPDINALVVTAPPEIMRQVKDVVAQLDIRRSQVLVEAIIAEVNVNTARQLGVDSAVLNDERIAAANILNPATGDAIGALGRTGAATTIQPSALGALLGTGLNVIGGKLSDSESSFVFLLRALAGDGNTNILSTPSLVTMDNEEAEISVGQEVPFLTGSFSNTGGTTGAVNPFQTIDRRDVGLTLGITPQINEGETIQLTINQEISSVQQGSGGAVDLITNKRTLNTTVMVDSGEILVLGGLIDDNVTESDQRVPILGSIPILGNLFRSRSVNKTKQNLMIFIRPVILRNREQSNFYTRKKYDQIRGVQLDARENGSNFLGRVERPVLVDLDRFGSVPPPEAMPRGARESGPARVAPGVADDYPRMPGSAPQQQQSDARPVPQSRPTAQVRQQEQQAAEDDEDQSRHRGDFRQEQGNTARKARWP